MQKHTVEPLNDNWKVPGKERTLAEVVTGGPDNSSANMSQQITTGRLVQWTRVSTAHKLMGQIGVFGRFACGTYCCRSARLARQCINQGSRASWKVLEFFSWKFQDLESPGN